MTKVLIRRGHTGTHTQRRMPCEDSDDRQPRGGRGRDGSFAATRQGIPEPPELNEVRRDPPLKALEEAWCCPHLVLRCLACRTARYRILVVLWHSVCSAFSQKSQEAKEFGI